VTNPNRILQWTVASNVCYGIVRNRGYSNRGE